ncbi:MAG: 50S ribosomal protein L23 [Candidatus Paceibacterota bacterium]
MSILNKFKKTKLQTDTDLTRTHTEKSPHKSASSPRESVHKSPASLVKYVWITEKATGLSNLRQYSFIIDRKANKPEIKKAIEQIYGVKVISVNVINIKGKPRRMGRTLGRTSSYKKAIVTLREGQKIDVMPT